jgi:hypothetical protein
MISIPNCEILCKKNRFSKAARLESSITPRQISKSVVDRAAPWLLKHASK